MKIYHELLKSKLSWGDVLSSNCINYGSTNYIMVDHLFWGVCQAKNLEIYFAKLFCEVGRENLEILENSSSRSRVFVVMG